MRMSFGLDTCTGLVVPPVSVVGSGFQVIGGTGAGVGLTTGDKVGKRVGVCVVASTGAKVDGTVGADVGSGGDVEREIGDVGIWAMGSDVGIW
jgi:hypothetical protein